MVIQGIQVLKKEMATHSSRLAWEILWTEEPCQLQPKGSQESDMTQQLNNKMKITELPNINLYSPHLHRLYIPGCLMTIRILSCQPVFSLLPDICDLPQQFPTYYDIRTLFQWVNSTLLKFNGGKLHTYLIHYWASLVAQLVKNSLAMQETWV